MEQHIILGNVVIAPDSARVWVAARPVQLTYSELEILLKLAQRPGRIIGRDDLSGGLRAGGLNGRALNVHIHRLRRKLQDSEPWRIETVRRRGFVLRARDGPKGLDESVTPGQPGYGQARGPHEWRKTDEHGKH